jgi:hypothetical protein
MLDAGILQGFDNDIRDQLAHCIQPCFDDSCDNVPQPQTSGLDWNAGTWTRLRRLRTRSKALR